MLAKRTAPEEVTYSSECSCENENGVARWRAKTDPSDPPRNPKDITPITPSEMAAWPGLGTSPRGGNRFGKEWSWYAMTGRVITVQAENDGDVHMVLVNANDRQPGKVIVEIPLGPRWCAMRTMAFSWTNAVFPFAANYRFNPFRLTQRHVITVVGKAFYDTDHAGKDIRGNRRPASEDKSIWEIHPVMSLQIVDPVTPSPSATSHAAAEKAPSPSAAPTPAPRVADQYVTLVRPVTVRVPYGTVVVPAGVKLIFVDEDPNTVRVRYLGQIYAVPSSALESE